jgi:hypothetical protein
MAAAGQRMARSERMPLHGGLGHRCSDWDTSVDEASLAIFNGAGRSDDGFVVTTWHADESLQETFEFSE